MGCVKSIEKNLIHKAINQTDPEYNKSKQGARGTLRLKISQNQDFLNHHIQYEYYLSQYATAQKIRRRQILQHLKIVLLRKKYFEKNYHIYQQLIQKSWVQRIFLECLEDAENQFFNLKNSYDDVRRKIADRFLFELYQYKQFMDAGYGSIIFKSKYEDNHVRDKLCWIVSKSDQVLFPLLKYLKTKFPQVADSSNIQFPDVQQMKKDVDLFQNFPNKQYTDPQYLNVNTIFHDLKFLIERSLVQFEDFNKDLKAILGPDTLTDSKVKYAEKHGKKIFTASPVRRIFIKWVQTLLQRYQKDIQKYKILDFLKSKIIIPENFQIKSVEGSQTTHNSILKILIQLLQQMKYSNIGQKNKKFGFYIYDLLRCKTHRATGQQIVQLLQKMKSTTKTPSGKKFEVVRVKNRFKTPNRDLMVNFRYGDIIVAQAQLCIDSSDVSEKTKKTNKFNHYLYELQRGIFGPTIQLMMQYEDFYRPDVEVEMFTGLVQKRNFEIQQKSRIIISQRKCINNHEMYKLNGPNFPFKHYLSIQNYICDFCYNFFKPTQKYDYCLRCGVMYCNGCSIQYKKYDFKKMNLSLANSQQHIQIHNETQLRKQISKDGAALILFYLPQSASSIVARDYYSYLRVLNKYFNNKIIYEKVLFMSFQQVGVKDFCDKVRIYTFPTLAIFDRNLKICKSIIGCSLEYALDMFKLFKIIRAGGKSQIQLNCLNHNPQKYLSLSYVPSVDGCNFCQAQKQKVQQAVEFIKKSPFSLSALDPRNMQCEQCKIHICKKCSTLAFQDQINYQDALGKSYLSYTQRMDFKSLYCLNNHKLKYQRGPKFNKMCLVCVQCRQNFFYNSQLGFAYCEVQNYYVLCPKCIGIQTVDINDAKQNKQLVTHLVEATAAEGAKCVDCKQYYKKVYRTRIKQKDYFEIKYGTEVHRWICKGLCYKGFENIIKNLTLELHLACFTCDIQICNQCTDKCKLLQQKVTYVSTLTENSTNYSCDKGHSIKKINKLSDQNQLKFSCQNCKSFYYAHTFHYSCDQCPERNWCIPCGTRKLKYVGKQLLCKNSHELKKVDDNSKLLIGFQCQICNKNVQRGNLNPVLTCNQCTYYFICFQCRCNMTGQSFKDKNNLVVYCAFDHFMTKKFDHKGILTPCLSCFASIKPPYYQCQSCNILYCLNCSIEKSQK